jgi:hypothetical protein
MVAIWTACQPIKNKHAVKFPAQGVRHNLQGSHGKDCSRLRRCLFMLRAVTQGEEGLGTWTSNDELTNGVIDLDEVIEEEQHKGIPRDEPKEHNEEVTTRNMTFYDIFIYDDVKFITK